MSLNYAGGSYHIETRPLISSTNQWTCFYMIGASVINELNKELKIATITVWKDGTSLSTVVECTKKFESPLTGRLQCLKNFLKHVQCYLLVNCFRLRYVSKNYVNCSLIVTVLKLPVKNCHIDIAMSRCFGNV